MLSGDSFAQIEKTMGDLPNTHPAKAPYGIFKLANRQIWGNIAIGLGNRLGVFQNELVDKITKYNEIDLEMPGIKPCAYFCVISDQDSSLEFLSSLFFSTLFVRLTNYARRHGNNGRLPVKVNVCLDEFCNIGKILDFKKIISTVRSRGINCQVIVQSAAQLSDRYEKKEWEELVGNCDIQLFLGCNDQMTADYISKKCGMATISVTNNSLPLAPLFSPILHSTRPYSQTRSNTQRALMLPDEVLRMPNSQVLVLLRGQKPLLLYKIIPDELPAFKKLSNVRIVDYIPEWKRMEDEAKLFSGLHKDCKPKDEAKGVDGIVVPEPESFDSTAMSPQERKPVGTVKYSFISELDESDGLLSDADDTLKPSETQITTDEQEEGFKGLFAAEEISPHDIIG
jgi:type IV secretion system protein VirD4